MLVLETIIHCIANNNYDEIAIYIIRNKKEKLQNKFIQGKN